MFRNLFKACNRLSINPGEEIDVPTIEQFTYKMIHPKVAHCIKIVCDTTAGELRADSALSFVCMGMAIARITVLRVYYTMLQLPLIEKKMLMDIKIPLSAIIGSEEPEE